MNVNLVIDTREQKPLVFRSTKDYQVVTKKLDFGDYGLEIDGELVASMERKSGIDLYGSLVQGHTRFIKELQRANDSGIHFEVLVEESYEHIANMQFNGSYRLRMRPNVFQKILHSTQQKYGLKIVYFDNRDAMQLYIRNRFKAIVKEQGTEVKME